MNDHLVAPHGGTLVDLLVSPARATELKESSRDWPSWDLTDRQLCDLELLLTGAFSPLRGFLGRKDYESVRDDVRLSDGILWPMPITLDVSPEIAGQLAPGKRLALRDPEGVMLAVLAVEDLWEPDLRAEAERVFGTDNVDHPGVFHLLNRTKPVYVGGMIEGLQRPLHYDFQDLRNTPRQLRDEFARLGWRRVVAFQTRNPMHRAHQELTLRAARDSEASLLVHPVSGLTKPGDVDHFTRVRCYRALMERYPAGTAKLPLLHLAMRMGGPREAVWHALIRKNHGCTHFIVGRDHAGPGSDSKGKPFYGPYDAQELMKEYRDELAERTIGKASIAAALLFILDLCNRHRAKLFVASTSEIYGKGGDRLDEDHDRVMGSVRNWRWAYACTKEMDEFLAVAYHEEHKLPVIIGRLFNTVGPRQTGQWGMVLPTFVRQALVGEPLTVYGDGAQRRCFCHVQDTVEAIMRLMAAEVAVGDIFNIGVEEEITILDLAHRVKVRTGSSSEVRLVPYQVAYGDGFEDMERRQPNIEKITSVVGWQPTRMLDDIIDETIAYHRATGASE